MSAWTASILRQVAKQKDIATFTAIYLMFVNIYMKTIIMLIIKNLFNWCLALNFWPMYKSRAIFWNDF